MKKIISILLLFFCSSLFSQNEKQDYSKLKILDDVKLSVEGVDLLGNTTQKNMEALKELKLTGLDAENFKIIYYHFKTNYKHSLTKDEFTDGIITEAMTKFFHDLESNCKVTFEEIVIKQTETGKLFKITPLTLVIKVD